MLLKTAQPERIYSIKIILDLAQEYLCLRFQVTLTHEGNLGDLLLRDVLGDVGLLDVDVHLGQVALGVLVNLTLQLPAEVFGYQLKVKRVKCL